MEMKILLYAVSVLLTFAGVIWFFQGIGTLPGSFMTGRSEWAIAGVVSGVLGVGLGLYARGRE